MAMQHNIDQTKKNKISNFKVFIKTIRRIMSYIGRTDKIYIGIVFVLIIISTLASIAGSLFVKVLIDDYITPLLGSSAPDFSGLFRVIIIMGGIYLLGVLANLIYNQLMVTVGQRAQRNIRDSMFSHMQTLPIRYFDTHNRGDVMSYYTNDIDTLRQMIIQSIPQIFISVATVSIVFCAMLFVSWPLTVIVIIMLSFTLLIAKKISGKSATYFVQQQYAIGAINGFIEEMINGQKVIKTFCYEEEVESRFDVFNEKLCQSTTNANKNANTLMPAMVNMGNLQFVLIAVAGGALAATGFSALSIGAIAAFLQLSRSFTIPINQASGEINSIIMALAGAERIFNLMDQEPEQDSGKVTLVNTTYDKDQWVETSERTGTWAWKQPHADGKVTHTPLTGDVRFFHVNFGYSPDKMVLHDVTLYAKPGEKVAFVGATGAGKTTITNLINRFYDIQSGEIHYDGINIEQIHKPDLRRSLGIVLQDTSLFSGTIRENIRYGKLDATDAEVYSAAKLANADLFIQSLPDGYDTVLTDDGSELSQGQRQLLSIARAAAANPPVMILDEATSSIDTRTEIIVQRGMDSLMTDRTVFVIAHRLSTIQNSDVIIVMDLGHIIERGTHKQLLQDKGEYYQLFTGAFELE